MAQLVFDWPLEPSFDSADFFVSEAQKEAAAMVLQKPWASYGMILRGPVLGGKSHLAAIFIRKTSAALFDMGKDGSLEAARAALEEKPSPVLVADSLQACAWTLPRQEQLLHLLNEVRQKDGRILLVHRAAPQAWGMSLADLVSRLCALDQAVILPPDDELVGLLFLKACYDKQFVMEEKTLHYVVRHLERSYEGVLAAAESLNRFCLSQQKKATVGLVKQWRKGLK